MEQTKNELNDLTDGNDNNDDDSSSTQEEKKKELMENSEAFNYSDSKTGKSISISSAVFNAHELANLSAEFLGLEFKTSISKNPEYCQ